MIPTRFAVRRRALALLSLLGSLWLTAGCGRAPTYANPDAAPKALQTVLDAWKSGKTPEGHSRESPICASDSRWEGGYKLVEYEIGLGETSGYSLNFPVTLRMEDAQGKKLHEKATYAVTTSPRLMVLRIEDM